MAQIIPDYRGQ